MSWYELITTHGRWLRNVEAEFRRGEFKVSWVTLKPGEEIAVLIDRHSNMAHLNGPLGDCQMLAAQHGYELVLRRKHEETFVERIEKVPRGDEERPIERTALIPSATPMPIRGL